MVADISVRNHLLQVLKDERRIQKRESIKKNMFAVSMNTQPETEISSEPCAGRQDLNGRGVVAKPSTPAPNLCESVSMTPHQTRRPHW